MIFMSKKRLNQSVQGLVSEEKVNKQRLLQVFNPQSFFVIGCSSFL